MTSNRYLHPMALSMKAGTLGVASMLRYGPPLCTFEVVAGLMGYVLKDSPQKSTAPEIAELKEIIDAYSRVDRRTKKHIRLRTCALLTRNSSYIDNATHAIGENDYNPKRHVRYLERIQLDGGVLPRIRITGKRRKAFIDKKMATILRILEEHGKLRGVEISRKSNGVVGLGSIYSELSFALLYLFAESEEVDSKTMLWSLTSRGKDAVDALTAYPTMSPAKMFWLGALMVTETMEAITEGHLYRKAANGKHSARLYRAMEDLREINLVSSADGVSTITKNGVAAFKKWAKVSAWFGMLEEDRFTDSTISTIMLR